MAHMSGMSGMDMSGMSSSNSSMNSMMTQFAAVLPTTPLWFSGWTPKNAGATVGACIGLFSLSVLVKLLGAIRQRTTLAWSIIRSHNNVQQRNPTNPIDKEAQPDSVNSETSRADEGHRLANPWTAEHDIPRGILAAIHAGLEYFLMLAVMTYNVYFFVAIILGLFAGEVAFGRWSSVVHGGSH